MPDRHPKIVRNSKNVRCKICTGIHDYLTRNSDDAACGTPVAFSHEKALQMARFRASGPQDVVRIPDDTVVVMDDSARRLPRSGTGTVRIAQFSRIERQV